MVIGRIALLLAGMGLAISTTANSQPKERILLQQLAPMSIGLFLSDADGLNEQPLFPASLDDYNPSFSADGAWIVFTSDRAGSADIYRVHSDGSDLERLTDSPSFDDQGVISPNGRTLAFVSTRDGGVANIWLLDIATRRVHNLTRNEHGNFRPAWSPDGKWIAFTSDRGESHRRSGPEQSPPAGSGCCGWELVQSTAIFIVHPDGSGLRRLTPPNQFAGSPKWSPDGKRIVYYRETDDKGPSQIASIDITSGAIQIHTAGAEVKLSPQYLDDSKIGYLSALDGKSGLGYTTGLRGPAGRIWNPSWSPDGKRVVYAKPMAQPGVESAPIAKIAGWNKEFEYYRTGDLIASSPDGRKFAIAKNHLLIITEFDGSNPKTIFEDKSATITSPVWSPDGKFIAFATGRFFARNPIRPTQLAIIRPDGSDHRILTQGENSSGFPSFSPDSQRLAYRVLGSEQGLRILSLDSGLVTKLSTQWDNFPAWSPRGDRIVFTGLRTGDFEIYSIEADGSDLRQLTHDHGNDGHPVWSPDGMSILFTSSRTGWKDEAMLSYAGGGRSPQSYGKLFTVRGDGTHLRQLTDNQWEEAPVAWLPMLAPVNSEQTGAR
jgi:Tol biopolymer transport system component